MPTPTRFDRPGALVVSLDFELIWGVLDRRDVDAYKPNLLGVRRVIPALLECFARHRIRATWATVGMLAHASRDDLLGSLPSLKPTYRDPSLDPYREITVVGASEDEDPLHLARTLVVQIADAPGQELATHTFGHFYALEAGQTRAQFEADLDAAIQVQRRFGSPPRSLVFPRNQLNPDYLASVIARGIVAVRGNQTHPAYAARPASEETLARRAVRICDSVAPIDRDVAYSWDSLRVSHRRTGVVDVRASGFLRPRGSGIRRGALGALQQRRLVSAIRDAAATNRIFHLWWHPHNFGRDLETNLAALESILHEVSLLRERFGFESLSMAEAADRVMAEG
jgi:peptidoglycan/xylan/chitin deacetylase (PgdA/CDA1 family)